MRAFASFRLRSVHIPSHHRRYSDLQEMYLIQSRSAVDRRRICLPAAANLVYRNLVLRALPCYHCLPCLRLQAGVCPHCGVGMGPVIRICRRFAVFFPLKPNCIFLVLHYCATFLLHPVETHYTHNIHLSVHCFVEPQSEPLSVSWNMPKEPRASSATPSSRRAPSIGPAPRTASTTWTAEEDEILMKERAHGSNWGPISAKHFPNKTPNACRKRHERLMERRRDEDWDELKLEHLATQYMDVRREMWGMLANRLVHGKRRQKPATPRPPRGKTPKRHRSPLKHAPRLRLRRAHPSPLLLLQQHPHPPPLLQLLAPPSPTLRPPPPLARLPPRRLRHRALSLRPRHLRRVLPADHALRPRRLGFLRHPLHPLFLVRQQLPGLPQTLRHDAPAVDSTRWRWRWGWGHAAGAAADSDAGPEPGAGAAREGGECGVGWGDVDSAAGAES
ncbi:hypothetical protein EV356DRAFT_233180 [Viridothelium virens]|uniref:Uncharacterized protein n=1 Tax=Viridothelium virens TaxID=1048519 RepID=A0A6A6H4I3_VIRVR|nr:hypothetical protein EV356DRAFT_233180 [Viridothelium virens]